MVEAATGAVATVVGRGEVVAKTAGVESVAGRAAGCWGAEEASAGGLRVVPEARSAVARVAAEVRGAARAVMGKAEGRKGEASSVAVRTATVERQAVGLAGTKVEARVEVEVRTEAAAVASAANAVVAMAMVEKALATLVRVEVAKARAVAATGAVATVEAARG